MSEWRVQYAMTARERGYRVVEAEDEAAAAGLVEGLLMDDPGAFDPTEEAEVDIEDVTPYISVGEERESQ